MRGRDYHRALNNDVAFEFYNNHSDGNTKNGLDRAQVEIGRQILPVVMGIERNGSI